MGKIVKYCSSCDEGFAEKFGFCPNCAAPLQAFEMNPLDGKPKTVEEPKAEKKTIEVAPITHVVREEKPKAAEASEDILEIADTAKADSKEAIPSPGFLSESFSADSGDAIEIPNADVIEHEAVKDEPVWTAPATIPSDSGEVYQGQAFHNYEPGKYTKEDDGGYYVTVIQEKNVKQRNLLLLGALALMLTVSFGSYLVSLFQKDLFVGAIGDERSLAYLIDEVPIVEEETPKKDKKDSGGGGGGGKNDPKPVNLGDRPDQTPNPLRPPDPKVPRLSDPDLVLPPPSTQGTVKNEKKYNQWGDPNSKFGDLSSGPGSGGGMGTGIGTGAGSGRGTGQGSGSGSGSGGGDGDGNGNGSGSGRSGVGEPPPRPVGVTSPLKILANPRATYTEAARTNNVQGSVLVKVTLLASGQVGSVTVVRGLPHGLSEKAIAAARLIRFEPKKVNGVPVTSIKTMEYTFSIY